jgi:uncharacterized RDD family membrane protein YckC
MSDRLIVETPEQISLELPLAGIGSRSLAVALDTLIQTAFAVLPLVVWGVLRGLGVVAAPPTTPRASAGWALAFWMLVVFAIQFGYFAFFEAIWKGQTPGKRAIRIRVISSNGRSINAYEAVARNLLRIVDSIPGVYAVGILCALLSSQSKRLGDFVADTVVVHERPVALLEPQGAHPARQSAAVATPPSAEAARLTAQEFQLIDAFLLRRSQLAAGVREHMARQIAHRIAGRLGISREEQQRPEQLLEELAAAYRDQPRLR